MATFTFQAIDGSGRTSSGTLAAASRDEAATILHARNLILMELREAAAGGAQLTDSEPIGLLGRFLPGGSAQVELGLYQLAVMLRNGVNVLTALRTVAAQSAILRLRQVWQRIAREVQAGGTMAAAMGRERRFPAMVAHLVKVGEQTGELDQVLERAAAIMRKRREIVSQQITALAYPVIVLVMSFAVAGWMVVGVIPALAKFLRTIGRQLPPITQALIDVSGFITTHLALAAIVLVAAAVALVALYRFPPTRLQFDRCLLRVPVLGPALRTASSALFARAMAVLMRSGVRVIDGLGTMAELMGNRWLSHTVSTGRDLVVRGAPLAQSLRAKGAFTPMLTGMIAIGEQSGSLDEVLDQLAAFHELALEQMLKRLSMVFEVLTLLAVGGVVGFVYISFFVALFAAG